MVTSHCPAAIASSILLSLSKMRGSFHPTAHDFFRAGFSQSLDHGGNKRLGIHFPERF